jgi:two-component system, response regulator YesN
MVKMLIVDDEAMERNSLCKFINWGMVGVEVIGDARNGKQAIEMVILSRPDIILTDVRMPVMDGVEMSKRIKALDPTIKIIFCSAYSDFEHAREAVNLNAFGYILKPIKEEEMLKLIKSAADRCIDERMHEAMYTKLKDSVSTRVPLVREAAIRDILTGSGYSNEEILWSSGLEWLVSGNDDVCLVLLRWVKNKSISSTDINRALDAVNKCFIHTVLTKLTSNKAAIIVQASCSKEEKDAVMSEFCKTITNYLMNKHGIDTTTVYSSGIADINELEHLLINAYKRLEFKTIYESDMVSEDDNKETKYPPYYSNFNETDNIIEVNTKDDMVKAIRQMNSELLCSLINSAFEEVRKKNKNRITDFYGIGFFVLSILVRESRELGYEPFSNQDDEINCWIALLGLNSIPKILKYLSNYAVHIIKTLREGKKENVDSQIAHIEKIIKQYYNTELTVEQIASMLHFTPNYLGTMFKAKKKVTINEYINKYRISKSMEFFHNEALSISEVARACGYENIPYFHTVFKKYASLTPKEYRQMIKASSGASNA